METKESMHGKAGLIKTRLVEIGDKIHIIEKEILIVLKVYF